MIKWNISFCRSYACLIKECCIKIKTRKNKPRLRKKFNILKNIYIKLSDVLDSQNKSKMREKLPVRASADVGAKGMCKMKTPRC